MSAPTTEPITSAASGETHFPWCDESTTHVPGDGGLAHHRRLGVVPVLANDLADEDERPDAPFVVELSGDDGGDPPTMLLAIDGWAECAVLDLGSIRRLRDLCARAARLLGDDDGFEVAAGDALALVSDEVVL